MGMPAHHYVYPARDRWTNTMPPLLHDDRRCPKCRAAVPLCVIDDCWDSETGEVYEWFGWSCCGVSEFESWGVSVG